MSPLRSGCVAAAIVFALVPVAAAQEMLPPRAAVSVPGLRDTARTLAIHGSAGNLQLPQIASNRRDSLKNGAIIGAAIAGVATGAFIGYLCHTFRSDEDMGCVQATLLYGGAAAGAGALAGAGIDSLFARRIGTVVAVRF